MANPKFTIQQLDRLSDRMKNCLDDTQCRTILKNYLQSLKKPMLLDTVKLWEAASNSTSWNEPVMMDLIEEIDDFNENPLLSISECQHKLDYTTGECCRILEKTLPKFIQYLNRHHKAGSC